MTGSDDLSAEALLVAAEAAAAAARARAQDHVAKAAEAEAEADEHDDTVRFLRKAISRYGHAQGVTSVEHSATSPNRLAQPSLPVAMPEHLDWRRLSRNEAILRAIFRAHAPVSPHAICEIMWGYGRNDKPKGVRNALTELKKQDLIVSQGYGAWVLTHRGNDALRGLRLAAQTSAVGEEAEAG
jgi:hypothetical protein